MAANTAWSYSDATDTLQGSLAETGLSRALQESEVEIDNEVRCIDIDPLPDGPNMRIVRQQDQRYQPWSKRVKGGIEVSMNASHTVRPANMITSLRTPRSHIS